MALEFTLIDCSTGLIYGPYDAFNPAREHAEDFEVWEIINREGDLVDWSAKPKAAASASAQAARCAGASPSAQANRASRAARLEGDHFAVISFHSHR